MVTGNSRLSKLNLTIYFVFFGELGRTQDNAPACFCSPFDVRLIAAGLFGLLVKTIPDWPDCRPLKSRKSRTARRLPVEIFIENLEISSGGTLHQSLVPAVRLI